MLALLRCTRFNTFRHHVSSTPILARALSLPPVNSKSSVSAPPSALPPIETYLSREQIARVNTLIFAARKRLLDGRPDDALDYFSLRLKSILSFEKDRNARLHAYETLASMFISHAADSQAFKIMKKLYRESMRPTAALRAKLVVAIHFESATRSKTDVDGEKMFDELKPIVTLPNFTERHLRELITIMARPPYVDMDLISRVVNYYTESRNTDMALATTNKLIQLHTQSRSTEDALSLLPAVPDPSSPSTRAPTNLDAAPFTTLISCLADSGFRASWRVDAILKRMDDLRIPPDLPLLNALIGTSVRHLNLYKAFAIYEIIRAMPLQEMIPDAYAFGSLFKAVQVTLHRATARTRRIRPPVNASTGRELYRDMVECHILSTVGVVNHPSAVITTSVLNVALRMFLFAGDYCAAYVVLKCFTMFHLPVDIKTYRIVLLTLLAHVRRDMVGARGEGEVRWVDRFIGGKQLANMRPRDITDGAIGDLLRFATYVPPPEDVVVGEAGKVVRRRRPFRVPSRAAITGEELDPVKRRWDIEPLERLVGRAILAALEDPTDAPDTHFQRAVTPVFQELVPVLTDEFKEEMKALRRQMAAEKRRERKLQEQALRELEEEARREQEEKQGRQK